MAVPLLQELGRNPDKVKEDIWCYDGPAFVSDGVLESLSELHAQLKVQRALQMTAELLQQHPSNKSLPGKQATRVKHFVKFVFEKATCGNERQTRLRKLDCDALKFCGLAYKVRDILELPPAEFDFLVANAADFIYRQKLSQYLYREDINKAVHGEFDPEDDDLFKEFLKSHVELRPTKRKRDKATSPNQQAGPDGELYGEPQSTRAQGPGSGLAQDSRLLERHSEAPTPQDAHRTLGMQVLGARQLVAYIS